jgi:hypothetical protein
MRRGRSYRGDVWQFRAPLSRRFLTEGGGVAAHAVSTFPLLQGVTHVTGRRESSQRSD